MKKLLKTLKYAFFLYALTAALGVAYVAVSWGLSKFGRDPLSPWAQAVAEAVITGKTSSADDTRVATEEELKSIEAVQIDDELVLQELRREILAAADEIQLLESSVVDQISKDFTKMNKRIAQQLEHILAPSAQVLNMILESDPKWRAAHGELKLDEKNLEAVLRGDSFEGADEKTHSIKVAELESGIRSVHEEIKRYRHVKSEFEDSEKRLERFRSMTAEGLTALLAAPGAGEPGISDAQAEQLLMSLDAAKVEQILQGISEENALRAARLAGRLLPRASGVAGGGG